MEKSNLDDTEADDQGGSTTPEVEGGGGALAPERTPTGPGKPKGHLRPDDLGLERTPTGPAKPKGRSEPDDE